MKCESCGRECQPGEKFCQQCGAKLPAADTSVNATVNTVPSISGTAAKAFPKNKIAVLGAAVVFIIAVIILIKAVGKGSDSFTIVSDPIMVHYSDDDESYIAVSTSGSTYNLDANRFDWLSYSLDRSVMALILDYNDSTGGTLACVSKNGKTHIADGVFRYALSDNGAGIAYITDVEDGIGELYICRLSDGSKTKISNDVFCQDFCYLTISPDGASVAYVGEYDEDSMEFEGYVSKKGAKPESLGTNIAPIVISDNADYIYYFKYDKDNSADFYVKHKKNSTKLASSSLYYFDGMYFNKDYSQVLYIDGSKTYVSVRGGDKSKISSSTLHTILVSNNAASRYIGTNLANVNVVVYGVESFANKVAMLQDSLVYINSDFEAEKITSNFRNYVISESGNSILYTDNNGDNLYYINDLSKSIEGKAIGEDLEINSLSATRDLKKIYFINRDDELHYTTGNGKSKKIADDAYYLIMHPNTNIAYFLVDYKNDSGMLYYSKNGRDKTAVAGADDVRSIYPIGSTVCYMANSEEYDGGDLYIAASGTSFSLVLEGVRN